MVKRIYDIKPPKVAHPIKHTSRKSGAKHHVKTTHRSKNRFPVKGILIGSGVVAVMVMAYLYITLPQARIEIAPKIDALVLQAQFTADTSVKTADFSKALIPAQYKEVSKNGDQEFPATGSSVSEGK